MQAAAHIVVERISMRAGGDAGGKVQKRVVQQRLADAANRPRRLGPN